MARLTSISGRQCPTGCADEEDLARAPNIFVIGMSRPKDRTTVDVLHLEADKRKDREWSNNIDPETLRPPRTSKQPPSLNELKPFQEKFSKRSPCQREQRRATEDDLVKHNEEMRNRVAPVVVTRHVLKIETHPKKGNS